MEKVPLLDKCDSKCSAKPHFLVKHRRDRTDLVFCGHHFNLYAPMLLDQGFVVLWSEDVPASV